MTGPGAAPLRRSSPLGRAPGRTGRTGRTGAVLGSVVLAVVAVLALTTVPARSGETDGTGAPDPARLRVITQTAWVEPDGVFRLQLRPDQPLDPDGDLRISLRQPVASRTEYLIGLEAAGPGPVTTELTVPTALAEGPDDDLVIRLATDATGTVPLADPGVYPVDVEVDLADGGTASVLTHIVRLPLDDDRPPLYVALVVPVAAEPLVRPTGGVAVTRPTLTRLERRITPLVDEADVPLTLVPGPETVASLTATGPGPALVRDLRQALPGRDVLSTTYVDLDVAAWTDAGLLDSLDRQLVAGETATQETLSVRPDRTIRHLATAPVGSTLRELRAEGTDRLIVPAETVPADQGPTVDAPWLGPIRLAGAGTQMTAAVTDRGLQSHLGRTGDQVLDAHRTLADLAVIALDRPDERSGMVLTLPTRAGLRTGYLETLLRYLDTGPLRPVAASTWFDTVSGPSAAADGGAPTEPLTRGVASRPTDILGRYPEQLSVTELTLSGFANLTRGADPSLADLERRVLVSGSAVLRPPERSAYLVAVGGVIRQRTDLIDTPSDQRVTLTSRSGRVPVTVRNATGAPVTVRMAFRSNRLEFPEGDVIEVGLDDGVTTVEVPVRARTTGSFPMDVTITSPDGVLAIAGTSITLRSTAVSGVGLILSIGAGLVLLTWWARHWRDKRRDHRLVPQEE